jgi:hypothetical protein
VAGAEKSAAQESANGIPSESGILNGEFQHLGASSPGLHAVQTRTREPHSYIEKKLDHPVQASTKNQGDIRNRRTSPPNHSLMKEWRRRVPAHLVYNIKTNYQPTSTIKISESMTITKIEVIRRTIDLQLWSRLQDDHGYQDFSIISYRWLNTTTLLLNLPLIVSQL